VGGPSNCSIRRAALPPPPPRARSLRVLHQAPPHLAFTPCPANPPPPTPTPTPTPTPMHPLGLAFSAPGRQRLAPLPHTLGPPPAAGAAPALCPNTPGYGLCGASTLLPPPPPGCTFPSLRVSLWQACDGEMVSWSPGNAPAKFATHFATEEDRLIARAAEGGSWALWMGVLNKAWLQLLKSLISVAPSHGAQP
jgi:hypothetical protein